MEQLPALATAPNTWGGGCSGTSISHSGSSIVHRVTGREELDWTSPDWNKPLLPLLLFTTPHCPLPPPPALLSLTFIKERMAASARASEPKTQQLGWGLKLSSIPQPTTMQRREQAALLPGRGGRPS